MDKKSLHVANANLSLMSSSAAPRRPSAVKAAPLELSKAMTVEQAFQAIALNCIAQIQANENGIVQTSDAESVHQMRVGLRRLRAALAMFSYRLQCPAVLKQELDWLVAQLGPARDWDVLASSTIGAFAAAAPQEARLAELQRAALGIAREKHDAAVAAVQSPRYARLILRLSAWVQGCGWRDAMPQHAQRVLSAAIRKFARHTLKHERRRLIKRGITMRGASPAVLHRVRIAAKRCRYAAEFFESLYSDKKMSPFIAALSTLQDDLGWLNDAAVADRLLKELPNRAEGLGYGIGFVRGCLATRVPVDARKVWKCWKAFTSINMHF